MPATSSQNGLSRCGKAIAIRVAKLYGICPCGIESWERFRNMLLRVRPSLK